jgi:hypothetical protein
MIMPKHKMNVNNKLEKMWTKNITAYFKLVTQHQPVRKSHIFQLGQPVSGPRSKLGTFKM